MCTIERGRAPSPPTASDGPLPLDPKLWPNLARHMRSLGKLAARAALAVAVGSACGGSPPPVAPGEPIPAPAEVTLGTMEVECDALLAALGHYKQCPNLDEYDRNDIAGWIEHAEQGFAAGKKANPDPQSRTAIAAACRKAVASVAAATERCHAGPRPQQ